MEKLGGEDKGSVQIDFQNLFGMSMIEQDTHLTSHMGIYNGWNIGCQNKVRYSNIRNGVTHDCKATGTTTEVTYWITMIIMEKRTMVVGVL